MRVCIVTTAFPRWPGDGRGTFILDAARALRAQGAQVRVIAMHSPGAKTREMMDSIEVIRPRYLWPERLEVLQKEGGGLPIVWRRSYLARLAILPFGLAHILAVVRHARNTDIIHANWTLSAAAAWVGQFLHRRPFVVTIHGSDIFQAVRLPFVARLTRIVLKQSSRVVAVSRSLADTAIALGLPAGLVDIVPDGVDTDWFRPASAEREPLIMYVGSLIERKGLRFLIQAMPEVLRRFPRYKLIIVGEGPQWAELAHLARSLAITEQVIFTGAQTPAQVSQWMQRARLFVLPSVEEGLGVVLLEALACGTPCVATRVGGIPDVLSSEVGFLVPPADHIALADAVTALLENPDLWENLSVNARAQAVQRYSWKSIAARLMQIYQAAIEASR